MAAGWSEAVDQSRGRLGWRLAAGTVVRTKDCLQVQAAVMFELITEGTQQEAKVKQQLQKQKHCNSFKDRSTTSFEQSLM